MENNRDQVFEEPLEMEDQPETERDYEEAYAGYEEGSSEEAYEEEEYEEDAYASEGEYEEEEYVEYEDDEEYVDEEEEEDEEEDMDDEEEADEEEDEVDDVAYIIQLFSFLERTLDSGTAVPLTTKRLVDIEKCFAIINDMKQNLPDGIQFGMKINAERDRILEKAENIASSKVTTATVKAKTIKDEANAYAASTMARVKSESKNMIQDAEAKAAAIIENATVKAKRMVSESEVMQRARSEAAVLIENARVEAHERRLKAVNDAYRLLDALEKQTAGITEAIARKKNEMIGNNNQQ